MAVSVQARRAAYARRVVAALAFWLAAVLFVIDVSLLSGWLMSEVAVAAPAEDSDPTPTPTPTPTPAASPEPTAPPSAAPTPLTAPPPTSETPSDSGLVAVALDGGAAISFPQPPSQTQEVVDVAGDEAILVVHTATTSDGTTYTMGVIEYPASVDVSDPAVNLIGSVSGAAGSANARVEGQEVTVYADAPAVDFTLETDAATVSARNVLVDRRLYMASVSYAGQAPAGAQAFLDSLVLPE